MRVTVRPSRAVGTAAAPPSKSMGHRALICAALAGGVSRIRGILPSEDLLATVDCLRALGASVELCGEEAAVTGLDPSAIPTALLPCRSSASTLRFLLPLALLGREGCRFTGSPGLFRRPMEVYAGLCGAQGLHYQQTDRSITVRGPLGPGKFILPGDLSSQFITGLLFALPLLDGPSVIRLVPPVESRPYIVMTLAVLRRFGVEADFSGPYTLVVPGGQQYAPRDLTIEGDWTQAAVLEALGLVGGDVTVTGLDPESSQGDRVFRSHFAALQAGTPTIDLSDCPDLGPVEMALAAALHGAEFTGVRRLRYKESDRLLAMSTELRKFGVYTVLREDSMRVRGTALRAPDGLLDGWNDHRVVMALALLCTLTGGAIEGAEAVDKSWPGFWAQLAGLGIRLEGANTP